MIPSPPVEIEFLRKMILIREFDELAIKLRTAGKIYGAVHPYVGQEAVAVGRVREPDERRPRDEHAPRPRPLHRQGRRRQAHDGRAVRPRRRLLQRQGRARCTSPTSRSACSAPTASSAAACRSRRGAALAAQIEGKGNVAVCFFGDGAAAEGEFHEALNISSVWKLPIVFVCENNQYAANNAVAVQHPVADVAVRAAAYGMPGVIDRRQRRARGVRGGARRPIERARRGEGPTLLECKTYRWHFHAMRDAPPPETRPADEIAQWKARDPIARFEPPTCIARRCRPTEIGRDAREASHAALKMARRLRRGEPVSGSEGSPGRHVRGVRE